VTLLHCCLVVDTMASLLTCYCSAETEASVEDGRVDLAGESEPGDPEIHQYLG
jgi:hypothetical protein